MHKKAAAQAGLQESFNKLIERLSSQIENVDKLMKQTAMPQYQAVPDHNILKNLLPECEDSDFWQNFKRAAPIIFCKLIEDDQQLKQMRDMSFIEEILKTKTSLSLIKSKLE